jgi:hypothetical protein
VTDKAVTFTLTARELDELIIRSIEVAINANPNRFRGNTGPMGMTPTVDLDGLATVADLNELRRHVDARLSGIHGALTDGSL